MMWLQMCTSLLGSIGVLLMRSLSLNRWDGQDVLIVLPFVVVSHSATGDVAFICDVGVFYCSACGL